MNSQPLLKHPRSEQFKILRLLLICMLSWSSSFTLTSVALRGFSPMCVSLLRYTVASVILIIYAIVTRMKLPPLRDLPSFILLGFLSFAGCNSLMNLGQKTVTAGTTGVLNALIPVFVTIMGSFLLKERIGLPGWIGVVISFVGVTIASNKRGFAAFEWAEGVVWILLSLVLAAAGVIWQKHLLRKYSTFQVMAGGLWCASLMLMVTAGPTMVKEFPSAPPSSLLAVLLLGIFPSFAAYTSWGKVLQMIPANEAEAFLNFDTVISFVIAWLVIGEVPGLNVLLGFVLITIGVTMLNRDGKKRKTA